MVTKAEIKKFLPSARADLVSAIADNWSAAEDAGINTPERIQQFFANIAVETAGLTSIAENLSYSSAQRIYDVFKGPSKNPRFKSVAECKPLVKNPKALAIKVYGGRMGNALAPSTDGYDFRGSGMLQTTGRDGFEAIGFDGNPDVLRTDPKQAFLTAVREWSKRGCNRLADAGKTTECRKAINGGTNGLEEVKAYLASARKVWPTDKAVKPKPAPSVENYYDGKPNDTVKGVQQRLDDLGYHEVGSVDGRWGSRTAGAVTTFQGDNGLELDPHITPVLLAALMTASPRVISDARANATVADLRADGDDEIKQTDQTKYGGYAMTGLGLFGGGSQALKSFQDTSETARSIWDTLQPVQDFIMSNIWVILAGAGLVFVWKSGILQRIRLEKHQTGKDVSA